MQNFLHFPNCNRPTNAFYLWVLLTFQFTVRELDSIKQSDHNEKFGQFISKVQCMLQVSHKQKPKITLWLNKAQSPLRQQVRDLLETCFLAGLRLACVRDRVALSKVHHASKSEDLFACMNPIDLT